MKAQKQFAVLLCVIFFGFIGTAMPYTLFAPFFLHPVDNSFISSQWPFSMRSVFFGITLASYPFGQFIGSPILGALSDQLGRRKLLLYTMLGTALFYFISGLSVQHGMIGLLILSRFISGVLEGNIAIAQACVADLPINKHKGFGAITAMASLGFVVGPLLGGVLSDNHLISWFNLSIPFYAASMMAILTATGVFIWVQETLNYQTVSKEPLIEQFNIWKRFYELSSNKKLFYLFIGGFFMYLATDTYYEFFPAFLVSRWQMATSEIALFNAVLSVALAIGGFLVPQLLTNKFSNMTNLRIMLLTYPAMFVFMLFTQHANFLYLQFAIIGVCYGAANNFHTVLISESAAIHQQGGVLGFRWGLRMLGDTFICILGGFSMIFSPSIPIIGASIFIILGLLFFLRKIPLAQELSNS